MPQDMNKLLVYRESLALSKEIYFALDKISGHFRLKDQLFGSSTAIPANLAEMAGMENRNQQAQKIRICIGEANETEFWIRFAREVGLIDQDKAQTYHNRIAIIRQMLFQLLRAIRQRQRSEN